MTDEKRNQLPFLKTDLEENATGAIYKVIKEFSARLEDELSLKIGDKVEVISDDKEYNDGWYMGKSLVSGKVGLYPKSFTQLVPSLSRPSLLRSRSRRVGSPASSSNNHSPVPFKSNNGTPISNDKAGRFDYGNIQTPSPKAYTSPEKDSSNNHITGALSDIDKALEELKNDVQPRFDETTISNESVDSAETLNPEFVETWSPEQVASYFKYLGFDSNSAEQFSKHKITGTILLELELAYLKELDISSFGTRFEIFKEIEALKEVARSAGDKTGSHTFDEKDEISVDSGSHGNGSSLLAPPSFHDRKDSDQGTAPLGVSKRETKPFDSSPVKPVQQNQHHYHQLKNKSNTAHPPSSQVPELPSGNIGDHLFLSPRRAPHPPSYLSPIQLQGSSAQNTPVTNKRNSYYESVGHSRKPSYDINPAFQFKGNHSRRSSYEPLQHSRNNSKSIGTFKSASVADLLSTLPSDNDRPASSIYMDSTSHSRHSSVNLRYNGHSRRASDLSTQTATKEEKKHRRHSSVFSFISGNNDYSPSKKENRSSFFSSSKTPTSRRNSALQIDRAPTLDPKNYSSPSPLKNDRRSVSAKESKRDLSQSNSQYNSNDQHGNDGLPQSPKRSVSEAFRNKTLRSVSSSTAVKKNNKKGTSAFMEGIKNISPQDSLKNADYYGWMNKRGGIAVGVWKHRYFALHGTRLSYFTSLKDSRERGLIDITSHKVLPAMDDDKLVSLYAATTGNGKFCFKLVPPAPGSKKGLTFTQPKVHYFAVETKEEMRNWMAALIKATIDIDDSVPVLSSCATPTVSLQRAQNLLSQARENAKKREDSRHLENAMKPDISGTSSISPDTDSYDSNLPHNNNLQSPNTTVNTNELKTPVLDSKANGFSSPYEIASNTFTPKSASSSNVQSPVDLDFKYSAVRSPKQRVTSNTTASTAAAIALSGGYENGGRRSHQDNRI